MPELAEQLVESDKSVELAINSVSPHEPKTELVSSVNRSGYFWQLLKVGMPLAFSDAIAVTTAMSIAYLITTALGKQINHFLPFTVSTAVAYTLCYWCTGLYPGVGLHPARELKHLFRGTLSATLALAFGLLLVSNAQSPYVWMVLIGFPFILGILPPVRSLTKAWMRRSDIGIPFFFIGKREQVLRVYAEMSRFGWTMLIPNGRFSEHAETPDFQEGRLLQNSELDLRFERQVTYYGDYSDLMLEAKRRSIHWLFVVDDGVQANCERTKFEFFSQFPEVVFIHPANSPQSSGSSVLCCGLASGVKVEESLQLKWPQLQKRAIDIVASGVGLACLSPLLLLVSILIRLTSPGPVFFSHKRIGKGGKEFSAWKFRSMIPNAAEVLEQHLLRHPELRAEWERDHKLKNDPRITWIGKIIRKTSLDELPQLWNVFVGEMSLVGPRPIVQAEIEKYGVTFNHYLRVTPGITGLWQISGRNNTTYDERLAYDEFYVRHWTPYLDIYILMRTVRTVLFCEGAY